MSRAMLVNKDEIIQAAKAIGADSLIESLNKLTTVVPPSAEEGMHPVRKTKRSLSHVSYTDGHGEIQSHEYTEWLCPVCDWFVGCHHKTTQGENKKPCNFCTRCGQKIDWAGIDPGEGYDAPVVP